jgi:hypothetical protein
VVVFLRFNFILFPLMLLYLGHLEDPIKMSHFSFSPHLLCSFTNPNNSTKAVTDEAPHIIMSCIYKAMAHKFIFCATCEVQVQYSRAKIGILMLRPDVLLCTVIKHHGQVVNTPASYLGDPRFKFRT